MLWIIFHVYITKLYNIVLEQRICYQYYKYHISPSATSITNTTYHHRLLVLQIPHITFGYQYYKYHISPSATSITNTTYHPRLLVLQIPHITFGYQFYKYHISPSATSITNTTYHPRLLVSQIPHITFGICGGVCMAQLCKLSVP